MKELDRFAFDYDSMKFNEKEEKSYDPNKDYQIGDVIVVKSTHNKYVITEKNYIYKDKIISDYAGKDYYKKDEKIHLFNKSDIEYEVLNENEHSHIK